jgi:ABC-type antimicrobial peptide transport system permease subunit
MFPNWLGKDTVVEIVGVVDDMLPAAVDGPSQSQIFVAEGRGANIGHVTLVVKTSGDPAAAAPMLRDVVQELDPFATVERMGPLKAKISASVAEPRFATFVLVTFAALALALAITGLYGVLSYDIAMRRRELAIRTALGATPGDLVRMVLREGLTATVIGLVVGMGLAMVATQAMVSLLFGVTPLDAVAFAAGPFVLLAVTCAACLLPARRAIGIAPAEALQAE